MLLFKNVYLIIRHEYSLLFVDLSKADKWHSISLQIPDCFVNFTLSINP